MALKDFSTLAVLVLWAGNAIAAPQPPYAEAYNYRVIETVTVTTTAYGEYLCPEPTLCPACPESSVSPTTSSILVIYPTAVVSTSSVALSSTVPSSTFSSSTPQPSSVSPSTSSTIQSSIAPTSAPSSSQPVTYVPTPVSSNAGAAPSTSSFVPAQTSSQLFSTLSSSESSEVPTLLPPSSTQPCATVTTTPDCSSQAAAISPCASLCFAAAVPKVGCGLTDYACQCSSANIQAFNSDVIGCLLQACPSELETVQLTGNALCSCALNPPAVATTCSVSVASSTSIGGSSSSLVLVISSSAPTSSSSSSSVVTSSSVYVPPAPSTILPPAPSLVYYGPPAPSTILPPAPSLVYYGPPPAETTSAPVYLQPPPPPVYYGQPPTLTKSTRPKNHGYGGYGHGGYGYGP